ncbi:DUF1283 family protein [Providencia rustigianii]|uniref:DUF1283 family protein n=1 Tax=Providencia rustigianii TaxID=158850 RepID=UPI00223F7CBA|nr:DUF1283 family protein [Providencia rustigianii]
MSTSMQFIKKSLIAICFCLPLMGMSAAQAANTSCTAGSTCVSVGSGNDPLNKEQARQEKEQWDETKMLRSKVNSRTEKEFDKIDAAFDAKDKCEKSLNLNAYWEPNTQRCLDVNSGRPIANP